MGGLGVLTSWARYVSHEEDFGENSQARSFRLDLGAVELVPQVALGVQGHHPNMGFDCPPSNPGSASCCVSQVA